MSLDSIISVTIDRNTTTPTRAGFGTPLVAAYVPQTLMPNRTASFNSLQEMVTAGFKSQDPAYLDAQAIFSQNPSPGTVKIGRRDTPVQQSIALTPPASNPAGTVFTVTVTGYGDSAFASRAATEDTVSYTTPSTITGAQAVTALKALFDALNGGSGQDGDWDYTAATTELVIESQNTTMSGMLFGVTASGLTVTDATTLTAPGDLSTDLTAINLYDPDWYGLVLDSNSADEIEEAATWVASAKKLFVAQTQDADVVSDPISADTTSIAYTLYNSERERTSLFYHRDNFDYVAGAMLGRALPTTPGSITWAYKTLQGISSQDLNTTELGNLHGTIDSPGGKYANAYITQSGIGHTRFGYVSSGEFADVIRGADALEARIKEDVFAALVQEDKLPLTDSGINVIRGIILGRLWEGVANGFLADDPEPSVTVPRASDLLAADKAARKLTGVTFRAYLAGAIHYTVIEGELNL